VIGTDGVLKAACRYRKKTVIASTSEIYGKNSKVPFCEDDDTTSGPTTKQRWAYACTKAMDEFAAFACARSHDLPVIIARFFNTVGPRQTGQYGMVIPSLMKQALLGKDLTVYGTGEQSRCFNNVSIVVDALEQLMETPKALGQVFNIGTDEKVSINQLAQRIIDITGSSSKIVHIPYSEAYQEGFEDMMVRVPSIEKIKSVIDYKLNKKLDDTLEEVRQDIQARLDAGTLT
jgi:UDP-glucose 4-epimerase